MSYFALEVYTHDVQVHQGALPNREQGQFPQLPYALGFAFLDYPLLLTYPTSEGWVPSSSGRGTDALYVFGSGKSCVLNTDAGELSFLLEQVPLYVSLLNVHALPKPSLLASGSTPLLISQPSPHPLHAPGSGLPHASVRTITLLTSDGQVAATARISCRLSNYGERIPPLAPPQFQPEQHVPKPASIARPVTAPSGGRMHPPRMTTTTGTHSTGGSGQPQPGYGGTRPLSHSMSLPTHNSPPALYFANQAGSTTSSGAGLMPEATFHQSSHQATTNQHGGYLPPPPRDAWPNQQLVTEYTLNTPLPAVPPNNNYHQSHRDLSPPTPHAMMPLGADSINNGHNGYNGYSSQGQRVRGAAAWGAPSDTARQQDQEQAEFDALEVAAARAAAQASAEANALAELEAALAAAKKAGTLGRTPRTPGLGKSTVMYGAGAGANNSGGRHTGAKSARPVTAGAARMVSGAAGTGSGNAASAAAQQARMQELSAPRGGPSMPLLRALLKHSALSAAHQVATRILTASPAKGVDTATPTPLRAAKSVIRARKQELHPVRPGVPIPPLSLAKGLPAKPKPRARPKLSLAAKLYQGSPPRTRRAPGRRTSVAVQAEMGQTASGPRSDEGQGDEGAVGHDTAGMAQAQVQQQHTQGLQSTGQMDEGSLEHARFLQGANNYLVNMASFASQPGLGMPGTATLMQQQTGVQGGSGGNSAGPGQTMGGVGSFSGAGQMPGSYPSTSSVGGAMPGSGVGVPHANLGFSNLQGQSAAGGRDPSSQPVTVGQLEAIIAAIRGQSGSTAMGANGFAYGQHPAAGSFQTSSVLMWEVMSLMTMRSVLSSAIGAMHTQMGSMAQQVVAHAVAPSLYGGSGLGLGLGGGGGGLMSALGSQQQQQTLAALQALLTNATGGSGGGMGGLMGSGSAPMQPQQQPQASAFAGAAGQPALSPRPHLEHTPSMRQVRFEDAQPGSSNDSLSLRRGEHDSAAPTPKPMPPSLTPSASVRTDLSRKNSTRQQSLASAAPSGSSEELLRSGSAKTISDELEAGGAGQATQPAGWARSNTFVAGKQQPAKSLSTDSCDDEEFEVDEVDAPIAKPQVITRNQSSAMMRVPSMPNNAITSTQTGGYARTLPHTPTDSVVDEAVDDLGDTMELLGSTPSSPRSLAQQHRGAVAPLRLPPHPSTYQPGPVYRNPSPTASVPSSVSSAMMGAPTHTVEPSPRSRAMSRRTADDGSLGIEERTPEVRPPRPMSRASSRRSAAYSDDMGSSYTFDSSVASSGSLQAYGAASAAVTRNTTAAASTTKPSRKPSQKSDPSNGRSAPPPATVESSVVSSVSSLFSSSESDADADFTRSSLLMDNRRTSMADPPPVQSRRLSAVQRDSTKSQLVFTASDLEDEDLEISYNYSDDEELAAMLSTPTGTAQPYGRQATQPSQSAAYDRRAPASQYQQGRQQPYGDGHRRDTYDDLGETADIMAEIDDMSDDEDSGMPAYNRSYTSRY